MIAALSDLRPVIQGKKWYWALFVNAINLMFVYSWRIYENAVGKNVQKKQFKDEIVGILLQVASENPAMSRGQAQVYQSQRQYGTMVKVTIHRIVLLKNASCAEKVQGSTAKSAKKHCTYPSASRFSTKSSFCNGSK